MTAAALASVLRDMAGVVAPGLGGAQFEASILQCLVKTQVEIYSRAPTTWISEVNRAEVVKAPTTVTLTVTQDAKNITFAGYQSWMLDCTIVIGVDPSQNQLTIDGASTVSLVKPYNGTSGTVSAIVYHDSIDLGTDVFRIGSPVTLDQRWELRPMDTVRDMQIAQPGIFQGIGPYYGSGYGGYANIRNVSNTVRTTSKQIATPVAFRTARAYSYNVAQTTRLSLSALPSQRFTINYPAQVAGLISDISDTTRPEYLPFGNDETIFVPWARWNFADNQHVTVNKADLKPAFDAATAMLKTFDVQPYKEDFIQMSGW